MSIEWDLVVNIFHGLITSPLIQTMVGAVSGAAAGALIAFHRQNIKERKIELENKIGLINYSLISLRVNIEKAINAKKFIVKRAKHAKAIKSIPGVKEFLQTGIWTTDINTYNGLSDDLKKYLKFLEQGDEKNVVLNLSQTDLTNVQSDFSFLDLPELEKMAGIAKKHPEFFTFAHRSKENFIELNDTNRKLTKSIMEFSLEDRRVDSLNLSFLLSLAQKMEEDIDAALFFMDKCKEMLYKICDETLPEKRSGIHKITIKKEFLEFMPEKDHFPGYESI